MNSWWVLALGFLAQGLFSARILVQWIMSEKAKKVVSPTIFWVISLVASYIFFIYGWLRQDFAIMLGQVISYYIYIWNIGQKGAWKKVPEFFRKLLLIILIFTPIAGIAFMVKDWQMVFETLLKNDNIPMGLVIFGSIGQIIFTFRFVYQWIYSSKKQESMLPSGFWIISLIGSFTIISYAIVRSDYVLILGQSVGFVSYIRNLMLWKRNAA